MLGTFKNLTQNHEAWQVTTTINHPISCFSQGKSCWTMETTTWRTYDWLQKVKHDDLKTFLNNSRTKGDQEKVAYQRPKCKKQEKNVDKGKLVLDKINKAIAKWERLLDKNIFFYNETQPMKPIVEHGDALHAKFDPSFNHNL
jgi:hypothetical protein